MPAALEKHHPPPGAGRLSQIKSSLRSIVARDLAVREENSLELCRLQKLSVCELLRVACFAYQPLDGVTFDSWRIFEINRRVVRKKSRHAYLYYFDDLSWSPFHCRSCSHSNSSTGPFDNRHAECDEVLKQQLQLSVNNDRKGKEKKIMTSLLNINIFFTTSIITL